MKKEITLDEIEKSFIQIGEFTIRYQWLKRALIVCYKDILNQNGEANMNVLEIALCKKSVDTLRKELRSTISELYAEELLINEKKKELNSVFGEIRKIWRLELDIRQANFVIDCKQNQTQLINIEFDRNEDQGLTQKNVHFSELGVDYYTVIMDRIQDVLFQIAYNIGEGKKLLCSDNDGGNLNIESWNEIITKPHQINGGMGFVFTHSVKTDKMKHLLKLNKRGKVYLPKGSRIESDLSK